VSDAQANLTHLLVGRHQAAGRGGELAVVDDTGRWSFDELDAAAARAAGSLTEAGVGRGDRVAIALPDGRAWCAAFLATVRIGAVAAPLEPGGRHLDEILTDLEPTVVVCATDEVLPGEVARLAPGTLLAGEPVAVAAVDPGDLAYMIFSSGSTGRPKGAMHAHRDLATSVEGYAHEILSLGPDDRCHSVARTFASLGFGNGFFRPLGRGAAAVFSAVRPTVRSVLDLVAREGITVLSGVPTFWAQLATFLERHTDPNALAHVRLAVSSGDALPAAVGERIRTIAGVDLVEGLGCSECSNIVISTRPGEPLPGTLGRAVAGVEIHLADEAGAQVPDGTPGRLWIKSPSNTTGYWRRPDETADLLNGDWLRMGDVLRVDDGVYRHLGRSDDLFKVDAKWVSPIEVEGTIHQHPGVVECAVVGRRDDAGLLRAAAIVVAHDAARVDPVGFADDLRRFVAHRLAPYMAPATVTIVDSLPRGATGKVDRRALRLRA
jgi:fatty-acyl-CoA synthase/benzoate-CoA ligase/fatty acid CoA ligase FadD22